MRLTDLKGGGIRVPAGEAASLRSLARFVSANAPSGPVLDLSNRPALYFFLERINPTRFYQVPLMEPFQREVVAAMNARPPLRRPPLFRNHA